MLSGGRVEGGGRSGLGIGEGVGGSERGEGERDLIFVLVHRG